MNNKLRTIRELVEEYILFAHDDDVLFEKFMITPSEISGLSDEDVLEIYDQTLLEDMLGGVIDELGEEDN